MIGKKITPPREKDEYMACSNFEGEPVYGFGKTSLSAQYNCDREKLWLSVLDIEHWKKKT